MKGFNIKGMFQGLGMKLKNASPEIKLAVGCVSLLAGTVYACVQTEKAKKAIAEANEKAAGVEATLKIDIPEGVEIAPETLKQLKVERGRNYFKIYGTLVYNLIKIYGLPALLWFGGMGAVVGSHCDVRKINKGLIADILASNELIKGYRERVKKAVGNEVEEKIFLGAQEGMVNVVEIDENTGAETVKQVKADVFDAQPGSIFARNFTAQTTDNLDRHFPLELLNSRVEKINLELELGVKRAYTALDIYRALGFSENALDEDTSIDPAKKDEIMSMLLRYGISGNARKVPDPEMRKLKVTCIRGYEEVFDENRKVKVFRPCARVDFNFYPLDGKI